MEYQEFEVRISRAERDQYLVEVLRSPAGETSTLTKLPIERAELHAQLAELRLPFTEKIQLVEMGQVLYDFLFMPPIARCWERSLGSVQAAEQGLNLRLRIEDTELAQLPWELIYDRDLERFLIASLQTPLLRYIPLPEPVLPVSIRPPLRLLLAISSPPDYPPLNVDREKQWITEALAHLFHRNAVSVDILESTTRQTLQTWLRRDYHILHYIGHGYVDEGIGSGNLVLTDESTQQASFQDAETLSYLLQYSSIRLVFLNACQTAVTSGTEAFLGVAQSTVRAGLPAVVAMQFDIPDASAANFARAFYGSLAEGFPVQAAVTEGRKAVLATTGPDFKDWATPALFMRSPTGVLFKQRTGTGIKVSIGGDVTSSSVVTAGRDITIRDLPEDQRSGGKYDIHVEQAHGLVIGDSARVEQHFPGDPPLRAESLRRQLRIHQSNLTRLEMQALEYGQADVPLWLLEEIKFTQAEIRRLEEELATPATIETVPELSQVRRILVEYFDLEELRTLCFDLGVDFDNLRGEGKSSKARELIAYLQRRDQLNRLTRYIRQLRPNISI